MLPFQEAVAQGMQRGRRCCWRWLLQELRNAGYDLKSTSLLQANLCSPGIEIPISVLKVYAGKAGWRTASFRRHEKAELLLHRLRLPRAEGCNISKTTIYQIQTKNGQCQEEAQRNKRRCLQQWLRAVRSLPGQVCLPSEAGRNHHSSEPTPTSSVLHPAPLLAKPQSVKSSLDISKGLDLTADRARDFNCSNKNSFERPSAKG